MIGAVVDRVPQLAAIVLLATFAVRGTPLLPYFADQFRWAAGAVAVVVVVSLFVRRVVVWAGSLAIIWFCAWGAYVVHDFYPARVGLYGAMQPFVIATLVAYSWPVQPRVFDRV